MSFGTYNLRARLSMAIVLLAPILLELYILIPEIGTLASSVIILLTTYGISCILIIYSRSVVDKARKKCFPDLLPAQKALLPSDTLIDDMTKQRYYSFLTLNLKSFKICESDKDMRVYSISAITWLIAQTRDATKFPLIAEENMNFGFACNMFGIKPIGIVLCIACLFFNASLIYFTSTEMIDISQLRVIISIAIDILFLSVWIWIINKRLVTISGTRYAKALLSACDTL